MWLTVKHNLTEVYKSHSVYGYKAATANKKGIENG